MDLILYSSLLGLSVLGGFLVQRHGMRLRRQRVRELFQAQLVTAPDAWLEAQAQRYADTGTSEFHRIETELARRLPWYQWLLASCTRGLPYGLAVCCALWIVGEVTRPAPRRITKPLHEIMTPPPPSSGPWSEETSSVVTGITEDGTMVGILQLCYVSPALCETVRPQVQLLQQLEAARIGTPGLTTEQRAILSQRYQQLREQLSTLPALPSE